MRDPEARRRLFLNALVLRHIDRLWAAPEQSRFATPGPERGRLRAANEARGVRLMGPGTGFSFTKRVRLGYNSAQIRNALNHKATSRSNHGNEKTTAKRL